MVTLKNTLLAPSKPKTRGVELRKFQVLGSGKNIRTNFFSYPPPPPGGTPRKKSCTSVPGIFFYPPPPGRTYEPTVSLHPKLGFRQGDSLSPLLFDVVAVLLIYDIKSLKVKLILLLYVDDILFCMPGRGA